MGPSPLSASGFLLPAQEVADEHRGGVGSEPPQRAERGVDEQYVERAAWFGQPESLVVVVTSASWLRPGLALCACRDRGAMVLPYPLAARSVPADQST